MINGRRFLALTIVTKSSQGRFDSTDAFNDWVEEEQPLAIVHVHYFHDSESHQRGYQAIYKENAAAAA